LQAAWKGYKARKAYQERLEDFRSHDDLWAKVYFLVLIAVARKVQSK
jgi:hypothetical protein